MERRKRESPDTAHSTVSPLTGDEDMFTWYEVGPAAPTLHQVDLDSGMAAAVPLAGLEDTGHPADRVWQVEPAPSTYFQLICPARLGSGAP